MDNKKSQKKLKKRTTPRGALVLTLALVFSAPILADTGKENDQIHFIVELTRHGSRGPLRCIKKKPWTEPVLCKTMITDVGIRQRYNLGLNTRNRYKEFFTKNGGLKEQEFWVRSTDRERTLKSAMAHMIGLLQNNNAKKLKFENNDSRLLPPLYKGQELFFDPSQEAFDTPLPNGFVPFSIYSEDQNTEELMSIDRCEGVTQYQLKKIDNHETSLIQKLDKSKKYTQLIADAMKAYGLPKTWMQNKSSADKCHWLSDYAIMDGQNSLNPTIPLNSTLYKQLIKCYSFNCFVGDQLQDRVTFSGIMERIVNWFNDKSNSTTNVADSDPGGKSALRYVLLSAHDDQVSNIMRLMGLNGLECNMKDLIDGTDTEDCLAYPGASSNVVWELITKKGQPQTEFQVKVSYEQKSVDFCKTGTVDEYNDYVCDLDKFLRVASTSYMIPNFREFCRIGVNMKQFVSHLEMVIIILLFIVVFLLGVIIVFIISRFYQKKNTIRIKTRRNDGSFISLKKDGGNPTGVVGRSEITPEGGDYKSMQQVTTIDMRRSML